MVSHQLLELEQSIHNLSLEDKLWLLDKIFEQVRGTSEHEQESNHQQNLQYDERAKPIWEIAVEIGAKIPDSEWEKVPSDLSKNFDLYQG
ncbi:hypothetical protein J0895_05725 [Phormidium pseudopriestleyi FRX01]|uniref:Uncharacterized protein n=1 Tax=Phormidium pseudopriestleyi FRX01 TaxID=1759528 RepID=A0ABS3FNQ8_9CYAN|nr:hypothetical protein [Phormidium pseudopriestleyi]MBO0348609.1 hypothetical protein [Phormidium pseudopriestleyi FRX01]